MGELFTPLGRPWASEKLQPRSSTPIREGRKKGSAMGGRDVGSVDRWNGEEN